MRCGMPSPPPLLEQKVDIHVIQVLLGHQKLETTSICTQVATAVLRCEGRGTDQIAYNSRSRSAVGTCPDQRLKARRKARGSE